MSSDAIATSQRTAVSPTTKSIFSPSSDKDPDERSDAKIDSNNRYDVSSGDDDWNDGFCKLVIDLPETETDGEKVNIDAPRQQVKNNNNNNSLGGSPCPGKVSNSDKLNPSQGKCNPKNSLVSSSTNAGKNVKSKPKKSAKSSNKHHGSSANSRTSSPTAQNNETTNQNQSKNSHVFGAQDSRSSGLTSNSLRASNSPDEVGGKKKSSKSGRSHHKKHKHSLEKNESKSEGEKIKTKSKHSSCTNSPTSASSHYTSNNVTGTNASLTLPIKPPSFHRSASPSLTAITTTSSAPKFPHSPQTQARIPGRAPIAPGSCGSVQAPYDKDTENSHIQNNRKKYRKGQTNSNIVSSVNNNHSCSAVSTQPRADANVTDAQFRSFGNSGKRDRNSLPSEGSGSKKIKLEMDSKSSFSKEESRSRNIINAPSPRQDAGTRVTSPRSAASPGNVVLHTASVESKPESKNSSPQIFASSTISTASQSKPSDSHTTSLSRQASGNQPEDGRKKSSQRSVGTLTLTADVGVMTEPDALGPCEPGTSVHLDGIVWHETDTGVLVVNVTWRNRTYVGTLLDATKHDWAPPRFSDSDLDIELRGKNGRPKRQRGNGTETTSSRKGRGRGNQSLADDAKGSPSAAAKRRGKNSESESFADDVSTIRTSAKRARVVPSRGGNTSTQQDRNTNGSNGSESSSCSSPVFIDCPHPKCNKRYRHINGLKYHQAHAHLDMEDNVKEELEIKEDNESKDSEVGSTTSSREEVEKISDSEAGVAKECASKRSSPAASLIENPAVSIEIPPAKESAALSGDQTKVTFMTIDAAVNEIERANSGAGVNETFKFSTDGIQQMIPVSGEQVSSAIISSVTEAVIKQAPALAQTSHSNSPYAMQAGRDMTINNVPMKRGTAIYPSVTPSTHVQEPSGVDSESALAVKALLQTQDSQDDLPGLTAPYSQDSPPPTLTLVSRTGPTEIQNHVKTSQSFSAGYPQPTSSVYPVTSAHPRLVPSSSPTRESLHNHFSVAMTNTIQNRHLSTQVATSSPTIFNTNTLNPPQNSTKIVPEDSTSGTTQHSGVHPGLKEHFLSVVPPSYSTYPANKMAKGKTVPIPVDPNHGLMISPTHFARATSPGSQSGSAKKMKKKKKKSDGGENPKTSEGSYQIKQELSVSQESPNITPGFPSNGAAAVLNNLATSYQNDQQKIQNPVGRPEQVAPPGQMVIKSEPGIRFPPSQHFGAMSVQSNRKVPGVVMPSSCSSVGQFSNNITVTGTFHPHPDPHKPQTAVSAQAQDRQRTARVSPSPNSSSRNMTKLPLKSQNETDKSRVDHPEHLQTVVKPLSDHPAFEGSINQRTKFTGVKSPATNISQSKDARTEMNMGKFQDTLMSTIENAYAGSRQPTPRSKASTPQLEMQRSDQNPARSRPASPKEQRPLFEDARPKPPVASPVVPRPRLPHEGVTPIPRPPGSPKLPVEVPLNPRGQYLQSIYNYPVANYGFVEGYPALMDPVRQQQQYIEYIQEFQKQHMLQQQHLLQQQQAQQQAQLHAERKNRKPLEPHPPKVAPKVEVAPIKSSPQNATNPSSEKGASWAAHHHIKRHSTGSISPFQNQIPKDKAHIPPLSHHPSPVALHPRYKSPQPSSHPQVSHTTPTHSRSHSVTVNPLPGMSGSPSISHPRADISDKGRRMDPPREDGRTPVRKPASPIPGSLNNERSPEKGKEGHPVTMYRTHGESPGHLPYFAAAPYPQVFDSRPAYRLPPFGVPGLQPGTPIFPTQQQWGPQHAALSKHSPVPVKPSIERPPSAPRSPREEHAQRGRTESKGRESFIHSSSKERRVREVPPIPRKLSRSPDPKPVSRTPLEKQSRSHTPTSNPDRAPSPPTQRHLHTHHHIHEGVPPYHPIIPQHYGYPGPIPAAPGLPASSDAMATGYPAQFPQKRE